MLILLYLIGLSGLKDPSKRPRFARRYIDQNRNSVRRSYTSQVESIADGAVLRQYTYHTGTENFDTEQGQAITAELVETAKRFNLTEQYGVSPQGQSCTPPELNR